MNSNDVGDRLDAEYMKGRCAQHGTLGLLEEMLSKVPRQEQP